MPQPIWFGNNQYQKYGNIKINIFLTLPNNLTQKPIDLLQILMFNKEFLKTHRKIA